MSNKIEKKKNNFTSALLSLEKALAGSKSREVEIAGIIQMFEYCYETCWRLLKANLEEKGVIAEYPKKVFVEAYNAALIDDEALWLEMIADRNLTAHTYQKETALKMIKKIEKNYFPLFLKVKNK